MSTLDTIWNEVSRPQKDGKRYIVFKGLQDLMYLYASGFVDAKKFSIQNWIDAFVPSKQPDSTYKVDQQQWLEKKKYHYTGPINRPFDPMTLEEKDYSEQEVSKLLVESIIPATIFDQSYATTIINNLKAQGRLKGGKFRVDTEVKKYLQTMMNTYPSPMRVLEVSVDHLRREKKGDVKMAQAAAQKSGFAAGQAAQKIAALRLSNLTGVKEAAPPAPPSQEAGISLKDLQKKRRPTGRI